MDFSYEFIKTIEKDEDYAQTNLEYKTGQIMDIADIHAYNMTKHRTAWGKGEKRNYHNGVRISFTSVGKPIPYEASCIIAYELNRSFAGAPCIMICNGKTKKIIYGVHYPPGYKESQDQLNKNKESDANISVDVG